MDHPPPPPPPAQIRFIEPSRTHGPKLNSENLDTPVVQGSGFRVQGSGFRAQGSGFTETIQGSGPGKASRKVSRSFVFGFFE